MDAHVHKATEALRNEFGTLAYAQSDFPMLMAWGVEDFSHTIRSLGCNYLSALGRSLGFWALSDYPVRVPRSRHGHSVRPDVVWWEKTHSDVVLLGEFERFDPCAPAKLVEKTRNLLQVHHALGERPRILLLMGWTSSGIDLGVRDQVRRVIYGGFNPAGAPGVPGLSGDSVFLHATAVFGDTNGMRRLLRVQT
jgi:hypothetical protein